MTKKDKTLKFLETVLSDFKKTGLLRTSASYIDCELCRIHDKKGYRDCKGCPFTDSYGTAGCVKLVGEVNFLFYNKQNLLEAVFGDFINDLKKLPSKRFTKQGWKPIDFSVYYSYDKKR